MRASCTRPWAESVPNPRGARQLLRERNWCLFPWNLAAAAAPTKFNNYRQLKAVLQSIPHIVSVTELGRGLCSDWFPVLEVSSVILNALVFSSCVCDLSKLINVIKEQADSNMVWALRRVQPTGQSSFLWESTCDSVSIWGLYLFIRHFSSGLSTLLFQWPWGLWETSDLVREKRTLYLEESTVDDKPQEHEDRK